MNRIEILTVGLTAVAVAYVAAAVAFFPGWVTPVFHFIAGVFQ